jgi:fructokinase
MITVIGEALIGLVPVPDSTSLRVIPGRGPVNVAIGAVRLGHPTALMARLSSDWFGQFLRHHAACNGVDLDAAPEADEPATITIALPGPAPHGKKSFYFQGAADWQWSTAELARIPAATSVLHLGSLACCMAPGAARILKAASRKRSSGALVCVDPDVCPEIMGTPARGRLLIEQSVRAADVVKASIEDIGWLYPGRSLEDVAGRWLTLGPDLVVITCGGDGAMAIRATRTVLHRRARRVRVADTTGAGDAFTSALLGWLHELGRAGGSLRALSGTDLTQMLDACILAAGVSCERMGADPPTTADLKNAVLQHPIAPAAVSSALQPVQVSCTGGQS